MGISLDSFGSKASKARAASRVGGGKPAPVEPTKPAPVVAEEPAPEPLKTMGEIIAEDMAGGGGHVAYPED